jgi:hypothetical protein
MGRAWVLGAGVMQLGQKADCSHLALRLRTYGTIPPFVHTCSWCGTY